MRSSRGRRKSLGHGRTFGRDLRGLAELSQPLYKLCQRVGSELRGYRLVAGTVALKVRYTDFETRSKQMSFPDPTDAHQDLYEATYELLSKMLAARGAPVRMIEVRVSGLHPATFQLDLFDPTRQRMRQLNDALDQLEARHGAGVVQPAWIQ